MIRSLLIGVCAGLLGLSAATAGIQDASSLGAAPPSTDLGKNASPAFSDDQVNATGAFGYRFPLAFPKGRFDVKPMLGLSYSSDAPLRGGVAAGWSLSVPMIRGDHSRGTLDASGRNPSREHYVSTFKGGGKLIRDSDAPIDGQNMDVYLALHDNDYARYEWVYPAPDSNDNTRWRVRTADGMSYEFGGESWDRAHLLRQIDPYGNLLLEYHWSRITEQMVIGDASHVASEWLLDRVDYHATDGTVYARVSLDYARGFCSGRRLPIGAAVDYHSGYAWMSGSRKLQQVRVQALRPEPVGNDLVLGDILRDVRVYALGYSAQTEDCDFNAGAPLRRLDYIQETAYAPVSQAPTTLPPIRFEYGEFDAQKMRYNKQPFAGLTLSRGADQRALTKTHPAVTEMLMDINGDGMQDRITRAAGNLPRNKPVRIEFGNGQGFDATNPVTFSFPGWLPFSSSDITGYDDLSLGLSGNLKFHADNTAQYVLTACGRLDTDLPPIRHGNQERFGFYDVNHDGLPDAVSELSYETRWIRETSLPKAPVATASAAGGIGTKALKDPWTDPDLCQMAVPEAAERWPVWKVLYNQGTGFSNEVVIMEAPLPLPANSPELAVGTPTSSSVAMEQVVRNPPHSSEHPEAIVGAGDLNGDGFGPDTFVREYRNTCVEGDRRDFCQGQAYYGYVCPSEGDGSSCFFVRTDGQLSPVDERMILLRNTAGQLERVDPSAARWHFPGLFYTSLVDIQKPTLNYHILTTNTSVLDVHGDGLPDLLTRGLSGDPSGLLLYPNLGQGWSDTPITLQPGSGRLISRNEAVVVEGGSNPTIGTANQEWVLVDLNNDGLLDQVDLSDDQNIWIHTNYGLGFDVTRRLFNLADRSNQNRLAGVLAGFTTMGSAPDPLRHWHRWGGFVDLTGDGLKDIVVWNQNTERYELFAASPKTAPHRLIAIHNGRGASTYIDYASTADRQVVVQGEYAGAWHGVRTPRWVVSRIVSDPGSSQPPMTTDYAYDYPVYRNDLYGHFDLRGFRQIVKVAPSGSQIVSRYDYDRHYAGLLVEKVTYAAEDLEHPFQVQTLQYDGLPALHDPDPDMLAGQTALNWHEIEQSTHHCQTPETGGVDPVAWCIENAQKQSITQEWVDIRYFGDGIDSNVPATRRVRIRFTGHDDGSGTFRRVRDGISNAYRIDLDEYAVKVAAMGTNDYTIGHPDLGRNLGYERHVWTNKLRELRQYETHVKEWEDRTNQSVHVRKQWFAHNPDGTVRFQITPQEFVIRSQGPGTHITYDAVGVTVTEQRRHVYANANAAPSIQVVKTITDIGTGVTLLTEGPNFVCTGGQACTAMDAQAIFERKRVEVDGLGRPLAEYVTVDDEVAGYREVKVAGHTYTDFPLQHHSDFAGPVLTEEHLMPDGSFLTTNTVTDGLGREIYRGVVTQGPYPQEIATGYHWDGAGNLIRIDVPDPRAIDGLQQVSYRFDYDSLQRPLRVLGPNDRLLSETRYEGSLVTVSSEAGEPGAPAAVKRLTKNPAGRLIQVEEQLDDGQWAMTQYRYDGNANMERVIDPVGVVTEMQHDSVGRRIGIASAGQVWRYAYDEGDNLVEITAPHPVGETEAYTTRMSYDSLNRLVRHSPAQADLSLDELAQFGVGPVEYVYDLAHPASGNARNLLGRLSYSSGPVVDNRYAYDAQGNLTQQQQTLKVPGLGQASETTLQSDASYHPDGQLDSLSMVDAGNGRLIAHPLTYSYDWRGLPQDLHYRGVQLVALRRNPAELVLERLIQPLSLGNISMAYAYDALGRLANLGVTASDGSQPYSQSYDYYLNGQVAQLIEQAADGNQRIMEFAWDSRHQLQLAEQSMSDPGYTSAFAYGPAGRLTSAQVGLGSSDPTALSGTRVPQRQVDYLYDLGDPQRLDRLVNPDGSVYADYAYDAAGNLTHRTLGDTSWELRYDGENRLRRVVRKGGASSETETFFYEGSQRVLAVRSDGRVRRWFGDAELEYAKGGIFFARSRYTAKLGQPVARIENAETIEYTLQTPQGHEALSLLLEPGTGAIQVQMGKLYGPFGEVLFSQLAKGRQGEDYTKEFNGKEYDHLSGLHYYGHRYYDPIALQWNRADPKYRFAPDTAFDEPRRMNLYAYTLNNPVSLVDPDGLDVVSTFFSIILDGKSSNDTVVGAGSVGQLADAAQNGQNDKPLRENASAAERTIYKMTPRQRYKIFRQQMSGKPPARGKRSPAKPSRSQLITARAYLSKRFDRNAQRHLAAGREAGELHDSPEAIRLSDKRKNGTITPDESSRLDNMAQRWEELTDREQKYLDAMMEDKDRIEEIDRQLNDTR